MSIRNDWVVACQMALVDRLTGKVSLIHVLDQLQVVRFPAILPPFHVVALWHNTLDQTVRAPLRIDIEEQGELDVSTLSEEPVEFAGRVGHRSICVVHALTVQRPGTYRIVARWLGQDGQWQDGSAHTFAIAAIPQPQQQAQA